MRRTAVPRPRIVSSASRSIRLAIAQSPSGPTKLRTSRPQRFSVVLGLSARPGWAIASPTSPPPSSTCQFDSTRSSREPFSCTKQPSVPAERLTWPMLTPGAIGFTRLRRSMRWGVKSRSITSVANVIPLASMASGISRVGAASSASRSNFWPTVNWSTSSSVRSPSVSL